MQSTILLLATHSVLAFGVDLQGSYDRVFVGLRPANERRRYKVTASLIGWELCCDIGYITTSY